MSRDHDRQARMLTLRRKREAGEEPTEPKLVERLQDMYLVIIHNVIIIMKYMVLGDRYHDVPGNNVWSAVSDDDDAQVEGRQGFETLNGQK